MLSPLDPPPPEHDAEDHDGEPLAHCEQQHQDPGCIPLCGRGTEGRGGIHGGCSKGKTRAMRREAGRGVCPSCPKERLSPIVWWALPKEGFLAPNTHRPILPVSRPLTLIP